MYNIVHGLLADIKTGPVFTCFGAWHFVFIGFFALLICAVFFALRKRGRTAYDRAAGVFISVAFGMYVADFFLMPLAYGYIDIEKLPFHVCTAMCVMCFLSRRVGFLKKYRVHFALLGFISNFVYLIYPAGVMWHMVGPLSYRVIQTLSFHGVMTAYGFFAIISDEDGLRFRRCYRDVVVLAGMTLWALVGNTLYNGESEGYSHFFNWFFVVRDPFYIFDAKTAPFIMPFLNIVVFFAVEIVVYLVYYLAKKRERQDRVSA